jgi:hypothetical protein
MKNLSSFLKENGLKLLEKTNDFIDSTKNKIKDNLLNDQLKRRFQLENPYKFIVSNQPTKVDLIKEITALNAKKYDEDHVFVFYGPKEENDLLIGDYIKDLATLEQFIIKDMVEVEVPVTYQDKVYEVVGLAVYCEEA